MCLPPLLRCTATCNLTLTTYVSYLVKLSGECVMRCSVMAYIFRSPNSCASGRVTGCFFVFGLSYLFSDSASVVMAACRVSGYHSDEWIRLGFTGGCVYDSSPQIIRHQCRSGKFQIRSATTSRQLTSSVTILSCKFMYYFVILPPPRQLCDRCCLSVIIILSWLRLRKPTLSTNPSHRRFLLPTGLPHDNGTGPDLSPIVSYQLKELITFRWWFGPLYGFRTTFLFPSPLRNRGC